MTNDTISRQAAIEAVLAINDYGNSDRANALGLAEFAITILPSAQPEQKRDMVEVVRCRDCEYRDGDYCHRFHDGYSAFIHLDNYCNYGEKRDE